MEKFGEKKFTFSVLEIVKGRELTLVREQEWLNSLLDSGRKVYNIKTDTPAFRREQKWRFLKDMPGITCVSLTDLNRRAGMILDMVRTGKVVVITRNNTPCATIRKFIPEMGNKIDWHPLFEKEEKNV